MATVTPTYKNTSSFTQYGTAIGAATATGNILVTLPVGYVSSSNYIALASHTDATAGLRLSIVNETATTFRIYWIGGGAGLHPFAWLTIGS